MESHSQRQDELQAARQAVEWLSELEEGQPQDRKAFVSWLTRSPVHVQEFLTMTAIDRYLEYVPADYPLELGKLRRSEAQAASLLRTEQKMGGRRRPMRLAHLLAVAAVLALAAVSVAWWRQAATSQRYVTSIGEQRTVELQDGSVVYLNARSRIDVHLTPKEREVHLAEGEALFKVKHDATRPFRVYADQAVIQALGTEFNVYRRERETMVAVLEGAVRISTLGGEEKTRQTSSVSVDALMAGQEARVAPAGKISVRKKLDVTKTLAWRERRLVFDATALPEIAAEFNRYNREPRIRIEGKDAERRRFTGVFDADDPEALLTLLEGDERLEVVWGDGEVVVR